MEKLNKLRELYQEKKNKNECSSEQITFLDTYLNDDYCFIRIKEKDALNIICFLGIPKEEAYKYYGDLLIEAINSSKGQKRS